MLLHQSVLLLQQGGLPTFVDIGSSFSAAAIAEDNLLAQMRLAGQRVAFVGDDTWMQLFPQNEFADARPFPSLNVRDIHTVDDGVWEVELNPLPPPLYPHIFSHFHPDTPHTSLQ